MEKDWPKDPDTELSVNVRLQAIPIDVLHRGEENGVTYAGSGGSATMTETVRIEEQDYSVTYAVNDFYPSPELPDTQPVGTILEIDGENSRIVLQRDVKRDPETGELSRDNWVDVTKWINGVWNASLTELDPAEGNNRWIQLQKDLNNRTYTLVLNKEVQQKIHFGLNHDAAGQGETIVPAYMLFRVEEENSEDYLVTYSPNNETGIEDSSVDGPLRVSNEALYSLPETGGAGTGVFYLTGLFLTAAAVGLLFRRRLGQQR